LVFFETFFIPFLKKIDGKQPLFSEQKIRIINLFKVTVIIKRRPSILDPQGKAVEKGAAHLGLKNIKDTRIGKFIEFTVDTDDQQTAEEEVKDYCIKLLSNPIMEDYEYSLEKVS
jgi:phosphoribosylformylglycinamidine synthase